MKQCLVIEKRGPWAEPKIYQFEGNKQQEQSRELDIPEFVLYSQRVKRQRGGNRRPRRKKPSFGRMLWNKVKGPLKFCAGVVGGLLGIWAWIVLFIIVLG